MSASKVEPDDGRDQFWAVVEDCLREFHGMKQEASRRRAARLRNAVERMKDAEEEYFYHSEPFDVACDIAGEQVNLEENLDLYLHIRDEKHGNGIAKQHVHRKPNLQE